MTDPDWLVIVDLARGDAAEAMRALAARIRDGNLSPLFLKTLAAQIDPDMATSHGTKLILKRPKKGHPKARPNVDLQVFMELQIDAYGEKFESVLSAAKAQFGASPTACKEALAAVRKRHQRDPEFWQARLKFWRELRDKEGHIAV